MAALKNTPASRKRKANTWKDIDQSVKPKAMSSASERRIWMGRAKVAGMALLVVAVLVGALQILPKLEAGPEILTKAGESMPIQQIDVLSDGSLPAAFVVDLIDIGEDANLLSVDLDSMKARLESLGQVESAVVSRRFPDSLEITIVERKPIVRMLAQRANGAKLALFVDKNGVVFEAKHLDPKFARSLPFLDGVALSMSEGSFSRIENIGPLAELLADAQAIAPHIYSRLRVVSLERSDRLIVKGSMAKEIVFDRNSDFRHQLGKLDYILDYYRGSAGKPFKRVDLTLEDQVPVTL